MNQQSNEKEKGRRRLLVVIIVVLLVLNAWLLYSLFNKNESLENTQGQLADVEIQKENLNSLLAETEDQLGFYKGRNAALDSIINVRDGEMDAKVAEIKKILRQKNATQAELNRARKLIAELQSDAKRYAAEIDSLSKENQFLRDENYAMQVEMENQQMVNDSLSNENAGLSEKVRVGSRLQATNMVAGGVKNNMFNKEKFTSRMNAAEKIKVGCYILPNEIAEPGSKTVYLKLLSPSGSTVAIEELGSGQFEYEGKPSLYTAKQTIDFKNEDDEVVFYWDKFEGMTEGEYEAILVCDGLRMGSAKFELR